MAPPRPLAVRSGNRAAGGMAGGPKPPPPRWAHTRAALGQLQERLLCSLCICILEEPVCLGGCEHVFCRKCVGPCVGSECPVCQTPTWVKDVQINRQLADMIQLCSKLHDVLDGEPKPAEKKRVFTSVKPSQAREAECKKKQIRMWYSPRSRKVKCVLDQAPRREPPAANGGAIYQTACSTFAFLPSPPSEESPKRKKKPASKQKKSKKQQLEAINKKWGFCKKNQAGDNATRNQNKGGEAQPHEDRAVSFCSQPVILCSPEPPTIEEASVELGPVKESSPVQNGSVCHSELAIQINPLEKCAERESTHTAGKEDFPVEEAASPVNATKRGRQQLRSLTPTSPASKRPRRGKRSTDSDLHGGFPDRSPPQSTERISQGNEHTTVAQISSSAECSASPPASKAAILGEARDLGSPNVCKSAILSPGTPVSSARSHAGSGSLGSPGNLSGARRNYKGETPLHIASIKGDLSSVEHLLNTGADPNVKDHAGWTPLHEACNHGHEKVVALLLQHRALVNTTGYQNDSPLHDAAKNGHVAIVELLLGHGASRDAVNIFGLRPVDLAEMEEMKSALLLPSGNTESLSAGLCPALVSPSQQREGHVVLMGSSLSSLQQKEVTKLGGILKAGRCTDFNSTVTHLIVPDGGVLSTMKGMLGILFGCWVLKFQWVEACLETKSRVQEEKYEIPGGPHKGRINREHLLPKLLDGCYFFFLGSFRNHRKEDLIELVKAAGGQVLARQPKPDSDVTQTINTVAYHAEAGSDQSFCTQYIIYDMSSSYRPERIRQGKVWTAPSSWLIDCITFFQLLPVTNKCVIIEAVKTDMGRLPPN